MVTGLQCTMVENFDGLKTSGVRGLGKTLIDVLNNVENRVPNWKLEETMNKTIKTKQIVLHSICLWNQSPKLTVWKMFLKRNQTKSRIRLFQAISRQLGEVVKLGLLFFVTTCFMTVSEVTNLGILTFTVQNIVKNTQ